MRFHKKLFLVTTVLVLLTMPAQANAQVILRGFGGPGFGSFGWGNPFGFPYYGGLGTYGGFGGYRPGTWGSPFMGPYGGMTGFPNYYNPGLSYGSPYGSMGYGNAYGNAGSVLYSGFGVGEPVRMRPSFYPAIAEPRREVIQAALGADDTRARLAIEVPTSDCKVYLNGVMMQQRGLERTFVTPRLDPATRYTFDVQIVWHDENGRNHTLRRQVGVRAGETSTLDVRGVN